jgi:hypothetical protein
MRSRAPEPQRRAVESAGTERAPKRARGRARRPGGTRHRCVTGHRGWEQLGMRQARMAHLLSRTQRNWRFADAT